MKIKTLFIILLLTQNALAFKQGIHKDTITTPALRDIDFDEKSIINIGFSNYYTDINEPQVAAAHGDNNLLGKSSDRLIGKMNEIIDNLQGCDRHVAINNLGQALHTVQDIYSHTNAVDNGLVDTLLGEGILQMSNGINMLDGVPVCYAPNNFSPGTGLLVSGYFSIPGFAVDGERGSCFGTIFVDPDLIIFPAPPHPDGMCCHLDLNKDDENALNGARTGAAQDAAYLATQNYIRIINDRIDDQFSETEAAYYKNMLKKQQRKTIFVIDTTGSMEDDHNRIKSSFNSYVNTILNNGEAPAFGLVTFKDENEITHHDLVCDISDFRQALNTIEAYGGDDCPEASGTAIEEALDSNFPFGSPDLGFRKGGEIFLYTDAPPSEESSAALSRTYRYAQSRSVSIHTVLTQGCSVVTGKNNITYTDAKNQSNKKRKNPAGFKSPNRIMTAKEFYQELSDKTGGISFQVSKDEIEPIMSLSMFMSEPTTELFYSQKIPVNSTTLTETLIKIDSSMSTGKTMIMVKTIDAAALPTITLSRPNGDIVLESDADITINNLSTIVTYTIDSPPQGEWKVSLSNGSSSYLVRTYAQTDFGIAGLSLLKEAPLNIRNVQFMPIEGNPIAGDELLLRLSLTQAPDTLTLKLLSENQTIIAEPVLTLVENSTKSYEATIVVPNENFNIKLEGMLNTSQFQREIPLSLKPTEVLKQLSSYQMSMVS